MPTGARAATGSHRGHSDRPARPERGQPPGTSSGVAGGRARLLPVDWPLGVVSAPRNSRGLPESRSRESRPTTRRPLEPHRHNGGCATHRPAVRRRDPSVLLAGTPTRISRSNRVGPSGQLSTLGAQEVAVKATFPLARRVCPVHDGWNYLHGISADEPSLGPSAPGCPPVHRHRYRSRCSGGSWSPAPRDLSSQRREGEIPHRLDWASIRFSRDALVWLGQFDVVGLHPPADSGSSMVDR
jgi:hypothetical protein